MKNFLTSILFLLLFSSLYSQDITGVVIDSLSHPLTGCTVMLISVQDSTLAGFEVTDEEGRFMLRDIPKEQYIFQVSFLGFAPIGDTLYVTGDLTLPDIILKKTDFKLDEILIEGEHVPIVTKKDTFIYNANAFDVQPHEVVEDLLRKMPGVEVESDGTVIAQGEKVEKVLVDGKTFFDGDTRTATKNLPAESIDKIKFYDKQSDESEFTGVKDGNEKKTMDLELKDDYKSGQFGRAHAGTGSDRFSDFRYKAGANINRFDKALQSSFIGSLDNTNIGGGSEGRGLSINRGVNGSNSGGDNRARMGAINMNYELTKKLRFNTSYRINSNSLDLISNTTEENYLSPELTFTEVEDQSRESSNLSHAINSSLLFNPDSSQQISFTGNLNIQKSDVSSGSESMIFDNSNFLQSNTLRDNLSDSDNNSWSGSLSYRKKIGVKRRILSSDLRYSSRINKALELNISDSEFTSNTEMDLLLNQRIEDNNDSDNYTFKIKYSEPIKDFDHLSLEYNLTNNGDELIYTTFDEIDSLLFINEDLSQHFRKDYITQTGTVSYQKVQEKYDYNVSLGLEANELEGSFFDGTDPIRKQGVFFVPSAQINFKLKSNRRIKLRYRTNVSEPSLRQLQPTISNFDPLNVYVGNPDLKPEYRHNGSLNYSHYDRFNFTSFFADVSYSYTNNKITSQTSIDEFLVRQTSPLNVKNEWNLYSSANYSRPIKPLFIKIKTGLRYAYGKSRVFLNEVETPTNRNNVSLRLEVENRDKSFFDTGIYTNISYNNTRYRESDISDQDFSSQTLGVRISITGIDKWQFKTNFDLRRFNQAGVSQQATVPNWSFDMSKYFLKDNRLQVKFTIHDILNRNQGVSSSASLNTTTFSSTNAVSRFFLLTASYNLKVF